MLLCPWQNILFQVLYCSRRLCIDGKSNHTKRWAYRQQMLHSATFLIWVLLISLAASAPYTPQPSLPELLGIATADCDPRACPVLTFPSGNKLRHVKTSQCAVTTASEPSYRSLPIDLSGNMAACCSRIRCGTQPPQEPAASLDLA